MFPVYILAGGRATRLKEIARETPKSLLSIEGRPFLSFQLEALAKSGVSNATLCIGHLGQQIISYIEKGDSFGLNIKFSDEGEERLGTGGALKRASANESSPFFVIYGDSYLSVDLKMLQSAFDPAAPGPMMSIYKNNGRFDKSNVVLKDDIARYSKNQELVGANYIDYGLGIFQRHHFKDFPYRFDLSETQEYFSRRRTLQYFIAERRFYEIGSADGLMAFKDYITSLNEKS